MRMLLRILACLLFISHVYPVNARLQKTGFDKSAFYSAIASNHVEDINTQLQALKVSTISEKEAYEGALLMKKAGLIVKAKEKLSLFKAGRIKLETAINKDKKNAEFNFLRLIIQEHAPKIVDYRNNIAYDLEAIRSNYASLSPVVQHAINDYSKKSKVLKPL